MTFCGIFSADYALRNLYFDPTACGSTMFDLLGPMPNARQPRLQSTTLDVTCMRRSQRCIQPFQSLNGTLYIYTSMTEFCPTIPLWKDPIPRLEGRGGLDSHVGCIYDGADHFVSASYMQTQEEGIRIQVDSAALSRIPTKYPSCPSAYG